MSILIPIEQVPNQSLSVLLDNVRYELTLRELNDGMGVSVSKSGVLLVSNVLAVSRRFILPYNYLALEGNFAFSTDNGEIPSWRSFNVTQQLYYFSASEVSSGTAS